MLEGKGSVDSCCAVGATAATELASTFAAIKSPADIPEAEPPAETMMGSGACPRAWRIATAGVLPFPSTLLLSGGLFYLL
jgi:hypothetical protein